MSSAQVEVLRNNYPQEIVELFEKHGFIWGGKWSHFDLMHFEYRPELLRKWRMVRGDASSSRFISLHMAPSLKTEEEGFARKKLLLGTL